MTQIVEIRYADGRVVSPEQFKAENKRFVYATHLPSAALLEIAGAELFTRDKTEAELLAEQPSTDPSDYPLLPWQFKAMVTYLGKDAEIRAAINAIPDALQKAVALSRYENATSYRHSDPFLQSMRVAIGMSEQTLTDAWMLAKDLTS